MSPTVPETPPEVHPVSSKEQSLVEVMQNDCPKLEEVAMTGSLEVVITRFQGQRRPALLLNEAVVSNVEASRQLAQICRATNSRLGRQREKLVQAIANAKAKAQYLDRRRGMARVFGRRTREGSEREKQDEAIFLLDKGYVEARDVWKGRKEELIELDSTMRNAEQEHYESLKRVQAACDEALTKAAILPKHLSEPELSTDESECLSECTNSTQYTPFVHEFVSVEKDHTHPTEVTRSGTTIAPPVEPEPALSKNDRWRERAEAERRLHIEYRRLGEAEEDLSMHRESYACQLEEVTDKKRKRTTGVESEFGPVFAGRFFYLTEQVRKTEISLDQARKIAKAAGVPNPPWQTSEFGSAQDDPIDESYQEMAMSRLNPKRIKLWCDATNDAREFDPVKIGSHNQIRPCDSASQEVDSALNVPSVKQESRTACPRTHLSPSPEPVRSTTPYTDLPEQSPSTHENSGIENVISDRNLDEDEKNFQFTFLGDVDASDSWSVFDALPRLRTKIDRRKNEEGTFRGISKSPIKNVRKRVRSRSVDVYQAIPKPRTDPGASGDRPAYTPIIEGLENPTPSKTTTNVVVAQSPAWNCETDPTWTLGKNINLDDDEEL
ncbi:hypothetical protein CC80DRAFT_507565 [Byssothecium circinans]|uniref:Uncharacterized protein n=1 Tax=Byssothecium circinans TaxID=147558 RepID=A0A6A5TL42_9PLEO|nr:hypothetical protein CC80DRAFT_507565 [Byssothecium circinans]